MTKKHSWPGLRLTISLIAAWVLLYSGAQLSAQNNDSESPYTRFGLGHISPAATTTQRAMGSAGLALSERGIINTLNPATYAAVDSQTFVFDFASSAGVQWFAEGAKRDARMVGNFEYAAFLFRATPWLAISGGIRPFSTVGYRVGSKRKLTDGSDRTYEINLRGRGNINDFYLGMGIKLHPSFRIGANVGMLFGSQLHSRTIDYNNPAAYNPLITERLKLRGLKTDVGLHYSLGLPHQGSFAMAITYSPSLPFSSELLRQESILKGQVPINLVSSDTIRQKDAFRTPHVAALGVLYSPNNKLTLLGDVHISVWQKAFKDTSLFEPQTSWRANLGMSYLPSEIERSLWKRIEYRAGLSAENAYLKLRTPQGGLAGYHRATAAFGIAIPMVDKRSYVDLALEYSHLFPQSPNKLSENMFRFTLGLRFNEGWFKPLKLE